MPAVGFRVTVQDVDRGPDDDDWFDEPDVEERRPVVAPDGSAARADDWLDEDAGRGQLGPTWTQAIDRRVVTVVVSLVVLLIAALAAAGVFSGGGTSTPLSTLTGTTTQTTTTPTTTTPAKQVPAPSTTLKPGDKGTQVAVLQRALASLGFSTGKADGQYGPATTSAVKRFQTSAGLTADGIVGSKTLQALGRALHP